MYLNNNNCVLRYLEMRFASPRSDDENKRQGYSVIVYDRIREDSFSPCAPPTPTPRNGARFTYDGILRSG